MSATAAAPEAHCGKEWWARQRTVPPTKPGCEEPRTTAGSQCSVKHPEHCAGAHASRVNHEVHPRSGAVYVVDGRDNAWRSMAPGRHAQGNTEAGCGRPEDRGVGTAKTVKRPPQQPAHLQYANYWAPLTRKRHIPPHSAQPQHTNQWALRTRKRHQQEHHSQRPTERSDPTQHAKGRTGDCPGPRKETTTRQNVTQRGGGG